MFGLSVILVLSVKLVLGLCSSIRGETAHPPCSSQSTFTLHNEPIEAGGDFDFAFRLSTGFDSYSSLCRGQWRGVGTDWQKCDQQSEDSTAMFRGTESGYLDITHRFLCERQNESTQGGDIALGIANGTVILDFSQGDLITLNAFIQVAHRKASRACTDASRQPQWIVDDFQYAAEIWITPGGPFGPGGPTGVIASVVFNLLNKANDFSIYCTAVYVSGSLDINNDTIIDPNRDWPCPFPSGSDLIPPEDYPTTSFRFDKAQRGLSLQQKWECDDSGAT
ncbi:hypothetical protein GGR54DRAFT_62659 [Hypoxylon sp. NC1633]|nr:hypothetical protein GGR54DRAFT_62659 [Hypoxylon sp. NC1633]